MKSHLTKQRIAALTLIEVLVVVFIIAFGVVLLLADLAAAKKKRARISCTSNLKQIGIAFRLWEGDNNDKYPMAVSVTNGGAMELVATGNVAACFRVMSNELSTPKILLCPEDAHRTFAANFSTGFSAANISYFLNPDAAEIYPRMILDGDDNLLVAGKPVPSGSLNLGTTSSVAWTQNRHHGAGNIGLADGSARQVTVSGLKNALIQTGVATNRWLIP